jgi:hypothetical protein
MLTAPAPVSVTDWLAAFDRFISQRSGIDPRNYGDRESLMSDYRPMLRAGRDARVMLRYLRRCHALTPELFADAIRSSRFDFNGQSLEYTTGQYFGVEYRAKACRVLADVIGMYLVPEGPYKARQEAARREFGRGMASRWFF